MRSRNPSWIVLLGLLGGCKKPPSGPPLHTIIVSPGPDFVMLRASFARREDLAYQDAHCTGTRLRDGRDPPSLQGGRVDVWLARGDALGQVERNPVGLYQRGVRYTLPHGAPVVASLTGSAEVPPHRFTSPAPSPSPVVRAAPANGFRLAPGAPLEIAWTGGDSSHVALTVMVTRGPASAPQEGYVLACTPPRAPGRFVIPGAALRAGLLPAGADTVSVDVRADSRVVEGDFALDVIPVGTDADLAVGAL